MLQKSAAAILFLIYANPILGAEFSIQCHAYNRFQDGIGESTNFNLQAPKEIGQVQSKLIRLGVFWVEAAVVKLGDNSFSVVANAGELDVDGNAIWKPRANGSLIQKDMEISYIKGDANHFSVTIGCSKS